MWWSTLFLYYTLSPSLSPHSLLSAITTPRCSGHRPSQVNVRDLEQKCRSQSEHFHQLSKDLLNFGLQSDTGDILKINPSRIPLSPDKKLPRVVVGFEAQPEKGGSVVPPHRQIRGNKKSVYIFFLFYSSVVVCVVFVTETTWLDISRPVGSTHSWNICSLRSLNKSIYQI